MMILPLKCRFVANKLRLQTVQSNQKWDIVLKVCNQYLEQKNKNKKDMRK